jgi:bisphosphoglycerate-independent phosphoglycerate mutase (AlkP superfamily)
MTQYKADFPFRVIFPPQVMTNVLAVFVFFEGIGMAIKEKY